MDLNAQFRWIENGDQAYAEMLAAMQFARQSIRLETYIITASPLADLIRRALISAAQRGVRVQVLADALGSMSLPKPFYTSLQQCGVEFRWFNPLTLHRLAFRDHRKILVCDEQVALIGGFNIAPEYQGDGVKRGWRDVGLIVRGALARELAGAFDEMFASADFEHPPFTRLRKSPRQKLVQVPEGELLLSGPGRNNPLKSALRNDLETASRVNFVCAYFLPTWRLRHQLTRAARRGAQVQLILPEKSDVPLSRLAAQSFYGRLLRAGVQIFEYRPQILHAKLLLLDDIIYVGSANLDARSLNINYELLLRLNNPELAAQGRQIFARDLTHCRQIDWATWKNSRTFWSKLRARWAYILLARIDPSLARYQWRKLLQSLALRKIPRRASR